MRVPVGEQGHGERPTMRAARYHGPAAGLRIETVPIPRPGPGEAVVRVLAAGVCHTDLQLLAGTLNLGVAPLTLGHEVAGTVAELGEGVGEPRVGERVAVYSYVPCGECDWCRNGREQVCPNTGPQVGFSGDGGFAEYLRVPARSLVPIPDGVGVAEAATFGCSVAAALHAVREVAEVRAGETVAVYGVGAVGLALIQLARLNGATVIAIGRSPKKLALAGELGAVATLDARGQDVVAEVLRATLSEGVDVVFELVGGAETMANSVAMLRRRGRLVFVGYGDDHLSVNPLHLVLKELQVRGSVGNTRRELAEVLGLAAAGRLRSAVGACLPLEGVNRALEMLRRGEVVGRVVLRPGLAAATNGHGVESDGADDGFGDAVRGRGEQRPYDDGVPSSVTGPEAATLAGAARVDNGRQMASPAVGARRASPSRRPEDSAVGESTGPAREYAGGARPLEAELLAFIGRGIDAPADDDRFNALALELFRYQFARNEPYQAFCRRRGGTPETVDHWRDVPAVPIAAFKEARLACEPIEGAREFNSSGTTNPEKKSRHFHPSLAVYDVNAALNFEAHLLPDGARPPQLVLFPPPEQMPNSSLAHWLALMARRFDPNGGCWFVGPDGLDGAALGAALAEAQADGRPVSLLAASFALVHFLDWCAAEGARFALPAGSRLMDTGGYKGRSRELSKAELYRLVGERLGIWEDHLVNMYGMTEHSTQFLDARLRDRVRGVEGPRYKTVPPWARTLVLDPDTLRPVRRGEPGLLCHLDLANRASVAAVLSEDIGYEAGGGFELIGRAQGTEARGCSIAVDELITAARAGNGAG